ncbi:DUF2314 domain-containing protein [Dactylosporangium sp. NPDC051485]|uniref:DUF2314 domain-containing protein n=1 Tax=Dactylosporangium sp. NPDC051485 TaxID=3154846 RepID=UPI003414C250
MEIVLSVPETVVATYVVATDRPPADAAAAARTVAEALDQPLRDTVLRMLDGPFTSVSTAPAGQAPPLPLDHLRLFGAPPARVQAVASAPYLVVCQAAFGPGWPPAHEWCARALAAGLAEATGGELIDMYTPQLLDPAAARASLPGAAGPGALSKWIVVPQSAGDRGLWMTTRGLGRFGLPELQAEDVPPTLAGAWTSALTGIARALLGRWARAVEHARGEAFVRLAADLTVTAADAILAYGGAPGPAEEAREARVQLRLDPAADPDMDTLLTVLPPDDFPASAGEFFAGVSAALFGTRGTSVRHTESGDAMDAAIATARETLPQARTRFLGDEFGPAKQHLIVKHRLHNAQGTEFVWSTVTAWPTPRRLHGVCMSDAQIDPSVRTGRPVMVEESVIVDWAVWVDGEGIVEGGWTNRVLGEQD